MASNPFSQFRAALNDYLSTDAFLAYTPTQQFGHRLQQELPHSLRDKIKLLLHPFVLCSLWNLSRQLTRLDDTRRRHNRHFMMRELERRTEFFDTVEPYPLDNQQRQAVIADEDNSLVIAGAGSGKTSTIVAKVKYLISALDVPPETILPISFTAKSAADMKERINTPGITPQTFHKFGLSVISAVEQERPKIFDDSNNNKLFRDFLDKLIKEPDYLTLLNSFFLNYLRIPKSQFDFSSHGDYIQYLKDQDYTTYKRVQILFQGRTTYKNETVKSIEECIIANFLIFNRVDYDYEAVYPLTYQSDGKRKTYRPDFTIHTPSGDIYLEHLGLDKHGNVPAFFAGPGETHNQASRRYQRLLSWKRTVHERNNTKLLETYSHQFTDGSLIGELTAQLVRAGVQLHPVSEAEAWQIIYDAGKDQVDGFISLCQTFLALLKSNQYTVSDARELVQSHQPNDFLRTRTRLFIDLFEPLYEMYQAQLRQQNELDFNDMISLATSYIEAGHYRREWRYIIIDEFQDLSVGRYRLLQAVRQQNPDVKFYCVGDDWQSIYRFTGSDIALFKSFEEYFGVTWKSKIETTYRFSNPLINMSSQFILKNPNQTPKSLRSLSDTRQTSYHIIASETTDGDDTAALLQALTNLHKLGLSPDSSIYLIGRYKFDLQRIKSVNQKLQVNLSGSYLKYTFNEGKHKGKTLTFSFITAHASKGLEADFIVILNCNSGKYGFPSGRADDPVLNLLLSSADQYENGEERRLFYVAMTRAKRHVIFICDSNRKSKFIKELQSSHEGDSLACPKCGTGEIKQRTGKYGLFYSCNNYRFGCDYTASPGSTHKN